MTEQWSRVGTGMVIYNHLGQILMGKRLSPYANNKWSNAGGRLEFGEDPMDCAIRECFEETNLKITKVEERGYLVDEENYNVEVRHWVTLMFSGLVFNMADLENVEPTKHSDWRWFHLDELPEDTWEPMKHWWRANKNASHLLSDLQVRHGARGLNFVTENKKS